ncbi:MAG: hypothetical protein BIFFINMI_02377 [Phycisphaerae bacterium]|nr:hypothetical protein [Phycisphaerae bacterium]
MQAPAADLHVRCRLLTSACGVLLVGLLLLPGCSRQRRSSPSRGDDGGAVVAGNGGGPAVAGAPARNPDGNGGQVTPQQPAPDNRQPTGHQGQAPPPTGFEGTFTQTGYRDKPDRLELTVNGDALGGKLTVAGQTYDIDGQIAGRTAKAKYTGHYNGECEFVLDGDKLTMNYMKEGQAGRAVHFERGQGRRADPDAAERAQRELEQLARNDADIVNHLRKMAGAWVSTDGGMRTVCTVEVRGKSITAKASNFQATSTMDGELDGWLVDGNWTQTSADGSGLFDVKGNFTMELNKDGNLVITVAGFKNGYPIRATSLFIRQP